MVIQAISKHQIAKKNKTSTKTLQIFLWMKSMVPKKKRSLILSHVQNIFHFQNPSHCPKISEPGQWTSAEKAWLPEGAKRND